MTDSNSLDKLFSKNITKEQFIKKFNDIKFHPENYEDMESVFTSDMDVEAVAELLTTVAGDDNNLSSEEIEALKNYYNDNDNNQSISLNDINELYSKTIRRLEDKNKPGGAENICNDTKNKPSSFGNNLNSQIDVINNLIDARKTLYESKIQRIQNELNSLVITSNNLSQAEKREYADNINKINKQRMKKLQKEAELKDTKEKMDLAKAEVEYIKQHKDISTPENKEKIKKYTKEYEDYSSEYTSISGDIDKITQKIQKLYDKQQLYINKITSEKSEINDRKQMLITSLKQEEESYVTDTKSYETQLSALKSSQEIARAHNSNNYSNEIYQDEDTSKFSYDAKELKSKWGKSHPDLSDGFYNKVCEISKRIGCEPNALMAVMQSESGIKTRVKNALGSGATGLIQFMPKTAKGLGTTTEKLSNMSAEEQLNYVEKYLKLNKKAAGFKENEKLDSGSLYALVLAPAYAKRDVLYKSGTKAYRMNSGLDRDGDDQIIKADLRVRLKSFMPK